MSYVVSKRSSLVYIFLVTVACGLGFFRIPGDATIAVLALPIFHIRSVTYQFVAVFALLLWPLGLYLLRGPLSESSTFPRAVYVTIWFVFVGLYLSFYVIIPWLRERQRHSA
jgi:hypothetical protein